MADSRIVGGPGHRHRRRTALAAAVGAVALLVGSSPPESVPDAPMPPW
ncbi:MAG: hypothetical protein QOE59_771 [Actinomycetota bacterium]|jgi:hypothetical protein|nr:hypothetical protein [Actinomycetota bacterium]